MSQRTLFFLLLALGLLVLDIYIFQGIKVLTAQTSGLWRKIIHGSYWFISIVGFLSLIASATFLPLDKWPEFIRVYWPATFFILAIVKLVYLPFLITDDLVRLIKLVTQAAYSGPSESMPGTRISRLKFLNLAGALVAAVPGIALIYGMIRGAYDYQIKKIPLKFSNLPTSFDGYKIVQISDVHTGSFMSREPLERAVGMINKLNADLVLFTGDLVNNKTDEVFDYVEVLKKISAKKGVYSILGNHDYGDYAEWPSEEIKRKNMDKMYQVHKEMGWDLLLNENRRVEENNEGIDLIGVENWSASNRFPKYGDLKKAHQGTSNPFKILLSHDPSHFDAQVNTEYQDIDLTLSGHTHGMQFGVEIPGFKWSPSQWVYKQWAGLYSKKNQYLYVNRGLGFLGYPGRVGIWPEITLIELKKG